MKYNSSYLQLIVVCALLVFVLSHSVVRVIKDPRCSSDYRRAVGQSQSLELSQVTGPVAERTRCSWITRSESLNKESIDLLVIF